MVNLGIKDPAIECKAFYQRHVKALGLADVDNVLCHSMDGALVSSDDSHPSRSPLLVHPDC